MVAIPKQWPFMDPSTAIYGPIFAGFRPSTPRSFCFGKRTQNHWRPGVALRGPLPWSRRFGLRNSLRSDSPRPHIGFGTGAQPRPQAPAIWRHGVAGVRIQKAKALPPHAHPLLDDRILVRLARTDAPEVRTTCEAEKAAG